jgi:hypothetical protein
MAVCFKLSLLKMGPYFMSADDFLLKQFLDEATSTLTYLIADLKLKPPQKINLAVPTDLNCGNLESK